jgi:transglutaminase-like putative cysteine protease
MEPSTRKIVAGVLIAAGVTSLGAVAVYAARRQGLLGALPSFGDAITRPGRRPRIVSRTQVGDKVITHYRARDIPINDRVQLIQDRVYKSIEKDPGTRELATKIISKCKSRDNMCEAQAIYDAVRARVRYIGDVAPIKFPDGAVEPIDFFQSARRTWEMGAGDCDDHVTLVASLLAVVGIPARLRVTAPTRTADWGHIYPIAGFPVESPKKWVALDTTLEAPTRMGHEVRFGRNLDYKPYTRDLPA